MLFSPGQDEFSSELEVVLEAVERQVSQLSVAELHPNPNLGRIVLSLSLSVSII
jgi:hypothetical protein